MEKYQGKSGGLENIKNKAESKYTNAKKVISKNEYAIQKLDKELDWQIKDNEKKTKKIEELTIALSQKNQIIDVLKNEIKKLKEELSAKNLNNNKEDRNKTNENNNEKLENEENEIEITKENYMPKKEKEDEKEDEKEEKKKGNEENDESSESKKRKKRKKRKILKKKKDADLESIVEALEENDE